MALTILYGYLLMDTPFRRSSLAAWRDKQGRNVIDTTHVFNCFNEYLRYAHEYPKVLIESDQN